jgi:hypothetical protein
MMTTTMTMMMMMMMMMMMRVHHHWQTQATSHVPSHTPLILDHMICHDLNQNDPVNLHETSAKKNKIQQN